MNAIEETALNSTKNWQIIKGEFEKLIMSDRKKYVHLNFYLTLIPQHYSLTLFISA